MFGLETETVALILSIASFTGVLVGPIVANWIRLIEQKRHHQGIQHRERQKYWLRVVRTLVRLRAQLQHLQGAREQQEIIEREEAYGKAYALMLSINNPEVRSLAEKVMTGEVSTERNEKLDAINAAIVRVGDLVIEIMEET